MTMCRRRRLQYIYIHIYIYTYYIYIDAEHSMLGAKQSRVEATTVHKHALEATVRSKSVHRRAFKHDSAQQSRNAYFRVVVVVVVVVCVVSLFR